ncbi:MAG: DUF222 domain-containing protein [Acidimicrobiales bacterium]
MTSLGGLGRELDQGLASFASGVTGCREQAAGRVEALLTSAEVARRVLVGYEARLVALADELSADGGPGAAPEDVLGRGGVSSAEAGRRAGRQRSIADLPEVSAVAGSGRANPECLDRLAGARSRLEGAAEEAAFVARDADLAEWVASLPPRRFARRVNRLVEQIAHDAGRNPAGRRPRELGLRLWQGADGLYRLHGVFDTEAAEILGAAFDREMSALARTRTDTDKAGEASAAGADDEAGEASAAPAGAVPGDVHEAGEAGAGVEPDAAGAADSISDDTNGAGSPSAGVGPDGPVASDRPTGEQADDAPESRRLRFDEQLRADALVEMLARAFRPGSEIARPLINVLVDAATVVGGEHGATVAEWGRSGEVIGPETRERLQCGAFWQPIVSDPAAGRPLDVGRSKRVATAKQRRALRALYSTCAFGDCDRPFAWCHIHHIRPWEESGPTDLDNLVPLCSRHHHLVHEGRWRIRLDDRRRLEIRRPDRRWWGYGLPDGPITRTAAAPPSRTADNPGPPPAQPPGAGPPAEPLDDNPGGPGRAHRPPDRRAGPNRRPRRRPRQVSDPAGPTAPDLRPAKPGPAARRPPVTAAR